MAAQESAKAAPARAAAAAPAASQATEPSPVVSEDDLPTSKLSADVLASFVTEAPAAGLRAIRLTPIGEDAATIGGSFLLEQGRHIIGRAEGTTMTVRHPQVSRHHAIIVVTGESVTVEDWKSANGTWVNAAKVERQPAVLNAGDTLAFGSVEFSVELIR